MFHGDPTDVEAKDASRPSGAQLVRYAQMRKTLNDASAILGLVANVVINGGQDAEPVRVQRSAKELIQIGQLDENRQFCSMSTSASWRPLVRASMPSSSRRTSRLSTPQIKSARRARATCWTSFVTSRTMICAISSTRVETTRRMLSTRSPARSRRRRAPAAVTIAAGDPDGLRMIALSEVLGDSIVRNGVTGIELASHIEVCASNLHALTHRNKGMGDQARDNIRAIVDHGIHCEIMLEVRCATGARFSAAV